LSFNWDESDLKKHLIKKELDKGIPLKKALEKLSKESKWEWLFQDPVKDAKELKKKTTSKMGNKKETVDGMIFDSKKEAEYYRQLKLRLRSKDIKTFARQVPFVLNEADGTKPVILIIDFVVWENDGTVHIQDIKASEYFKTDVYKVKKRLFESQSGLRIEEIYEV